VTRVTVDLNRCQGYGNCVSAAPGVFDLGDSGLVVLLKEDVNDEELAAVRQAVGLCPVAAIVLEEG
jgi:ferredoxin/phthalate 3,4-dioxygenase ferredoxin subunit